MILFSSSVQAAEPDYSSELPRVPHKSPSEALKAFDIHPEFDIELVASEPLVADPVAMAFDEDGKLFVAEMRGYSEQRDENRGAIRKLEDTDGDGAFDKSTIYADNLNWPTAIACYDGGIFVGAAPEILYLKDTTGDGHADLRRVLFTGFGFGNVQGLLNSFQWGMDNRLHGSASTNGGSIRPADNPKAKPISVRGCRFAIDPKEMTIEALSGTGQCGLTFDRWGDVYTSANSYPVQAILFDDRYLARNPFLAAPNPRVSVYAAGPVAEVFRASPAEPWRVVRSRLRSTGVIRGLVERGGKPAGYITGATSVTVYQGDAFPESFRGNAFIGEVAGNLVHRMVLQPDGLTVTGLRADPDREFLTSTDIWFRPTFFANAPDGTLYVGDMYREVIEHPESMPDSIKKHLDLTSGRERGRIYRIAPRGFKQPAPLQLSTASTEELIAELAHPNGWRRETAARLLYEQANPEAPGRLKQLIRETDVPEGKLRALYLLDSLSQLDSDTVLFCLADENPHIRRHAVKLAETFCAKDNPIQDRLRAMIHDPDARVRYQLAFTLGELPEEMQAGAILQLVRHDVSNRWVRLALLSSLSSRPDHLLSKLLTDDTFRTGESNHAFLAELSELIGSKQNEAETRGALAALDQLAQASSDQDQQLTERMLVSLADATARRGGSVAKQIESIPGDRLSKILDSILAEALESAKNENLKPKRRVAAIRRLRVAPFQEIKEPLSELIDYRQPLMIQTEAVSTLTRFDQPEVANLLLASWSGMGPRLRDTTLDAIFSRREWLETLLDELESGAVPKRDLPLARVSSLTGSRESSISGRAKKLFGEQAPGKRSAIVAKYKGVLDTKGDFAQGKKVFQKHCSSCHRLENVGHEIGPNLSAIKNRGKEFILTNILDPNREVNPEYKGYIIQTARGRILSGVLAAETANSVILKRGDNATDTILREDIEEMQSSGISIMPEGLEKEIDPSAMSDLLEYLMTVRQ